MKLSDTLSSDYAPRQVPRQRAIMPTGLSMILCAAFSLTIWFATIVAAARAADRVAEMLVQSRLFGA